MTNIDHNVRDLSKKNFALRQDTGTFIDAYQQGLLAVDLQGGWLDLSQTKSYDDTTLQLLFSTAKGVLVAAVALCIQEDWLGYRIAHVDYTIHLPK